MPAPLLTLQDIRLGIGSTSLLDGAELSVEAGERLCVVGRNGSGKSTLLRIAAGLIAPDSGRRFAQPGATIQYLPQEPDIARFATTLDCVLDNLAPGDDPQRAYYLLGELGLTGQEALVMLSGGQARRAALARALAPDPDVLLLDEPTSHLDLPAILWLERELSRMRDRKIVAEEHWVRYGVTARRKRNVRRMAELGEMRRARRDAPSNWARCG